MSLILVGASIIVKPELFLWCDIAVRDCTEGKVYEVIPYNDEAEYQLGDSDDGGMVTFIDDVYDEVNIYNADVIVVTTGEYSHE